MKRILSILLSVTIIATLLVSMSVTSFAAATATETQATVSTVIEEVEDPSELTEIETLTEEEYADGEDYLDRNPGHFIYKVTTTIAGLNLSSEQIDGANSYRGTYLSTFAMAYILDDGALAVYDKTKLLWIDTTKNDVAKIVNIKTTGDNASFINDGTKISESAGYTKSGSAETDTAFFEWYMITTTDTFEMEYASDLTTFTCCIVDGDSRGTSPSLETHDGIQYDGSRTTTFPDGEVVVSDATYVDVRPHYSVVGGVIQEPSEEPETYAFVVYGEGDVVLANETLEEGAAIEMPTAPAVEGKTFKGWAESEGGAIVTPATVMGTEDLTYYAVYETNKYTITFKANGGVISTQTVEHGVMPVAPAVNVDGFTFGGWDDDVVVATGDKTYTAILTPNAPTQYEITFVVDGDETIVMTNAGISPVYTKDTPSKDGHTFEGWEAEDGTVYTGELPVAIANATYEAVFAPIPAVDSKVTITAVDRITGDIFPISGKGTAEVTTLSGKKETIEAARLHRVHTTFTYEPGDYPLVEMGMLFVPKVVVDEAGIAKDAEEIANAGIAKDANCKNLPGEITGGVANFIFKAGLVDVPTTIEGKSTKGIIIYAIPYYTLSDGTIKYHGVFDTEF